MISSNSFFQPVDNDSKRRRALANVYEFLLKLAEEKKVTPPVLNSETPKENSSVPLQQNIPS
jgi:hypothetical protein